LFQAPELAPTSFRPSWLLLLVAPQYLVQVSGKNFSKLVVTEVISTTLIHGSSPALILKNALMAHLGIHRRLLGMIQQFKQWLKTCVTKKLF